MSDMNMLMWKIAIIMTLSAPIVVGVIFIMVVIVTDIQKKKRNKYFDELLQKVLREKGLDYAHKMADITVKCGLGIDYLIQTFEKDLGIKNNTRRK